MIKTKEKNECGKVRNASNPYEVWEGSLMGVPATWKVLKKYQKPSLEASNPYARWFCEVTTPMCPDGELGDVYVRDIKSAARKIA